MSATEITKLPPLEYHDRTKHNFGRYAASLGYMDWATQPNPYRRFPGAPVHSLPLPPAGSTHFPDHHLPYHDMYELSAPSAQCDQSFISRLLYYSMALAAWKQSGQSAWSLRVNPSSGNLHPTEAYIIAGPLRGLSDSPGVYHYAPALHALEQRAKIPTEVWEGLTKQRVGKDVLLIGLSSIFWREAWKYGERAYRYCNHDTGHALAAIRLAASMLGWRLVALTDLSDDDVSNVLGLNRDQEFFKEEREEPDLLAVLYPSTSTRPSLDISRFGQEVAHSAQWSGHANRLSEKRHEWEVIDQVAAACVKPSTPGLSDKALSGLGGGATELWKPPPGTHIGMHTQLTAQQIVRQRRSVWEMDGTKNIAKETFVSILSRTMPDPSSAPWDAQSWPILIPCLAMFVHRVDDVPSGMYVLVRDLSMLADLQRTMKPSTFEFAWKAVPNHLNLPLYALSLPDVKMVAKRVSCNQDIAGDGAFSLGMIANFEKSLSTLGPHAYRWMFWEAGMIGQVLYLEAEASGLRGTGIGCYFDDPVHQMFGISDHSLQSMYHFTIGGAVEDRRLRTFAGYGDAPVLDRWSEDSADL
mmetsp:Transcript_48611/g.80917  ORF Transcript_48611/g.80917 Transcript_48611/m.80917 type:complete len:582 (+) Transcript_48611:292-2037(+)